MQLMHMQFLVSFVMQLTTSASNQQLIDFLINRSCDIYMLNDLGGMDTFRSSFVDDALFHPGISCICSTCRLEDAMRAKSTLMNLYRVSRHRTHALPMLIIFFGSHYPPLNELVQLYVSGFFESGLTVKLVQDSQANKNDTIIL
uniref:Uncharacterized protein n=1 Tax=Anopheles farauti TaxID=69004 RepID=A0A182Q7R4_9DIPT